MFVLCKTLSIFTIYPFNITVLPNKHLILKVILLLLCLAGASLCVSAQGAESFDKIYYKTYFETSQTDLNRALEVADSLYEHAPTPTLQVKCRMLSATLLQNASDPKRAANYAEMAQEIVAKTNDYNWQARVAGFLATQYRLMKIYHKAKEYTDKAIAAAGKISNPEAANNIMGLMYQEKSSYELERKGFRQAITHVRSSQYYLNRTTKDVNFLTANNEQIMGEAYVGLKLYDSSLYHYQKGLKALEQVPENYLKGALINGLAVSYLEQGKLPEARRWLDSAEAIARRSDNLELQNAIYETLKTYAAKVKDIEQISLAQQKQDTLRSVIADRKDSFMIQAMANLENNYNKEARRGSYKNILILVALFVIAGIMVYVILLKRQQKAKFRKVLTRIKQREEQQRLKQAAQPVPAVEVHQFAEPVPAEEEVQKEPDALMMTPETMQKLLLSLDEFEAGTLFTNRNMSLSYLATHINTNTKYLSRVINLHKQKDFNGYINELRVNYIIVQLNSDPVWRKYKISTLAEEAGFSSHSKFATVFKSITGLSPSLFIQYLEKDVPS